MHGPMSSKPLYSVAPGRLQYICDADSPALPSIPPTVQTLIVVLESTAATLAASQNPAPVVAIPVIPAPPSPPANVVCPRQPASGSQVAELETTR